VKKDFASAKKTMTEAVLYDSINGNSQMTLMEINFLEGDKKQAYFYSTKLLQLKHPSEEKALQMAIHCALEAELYSSALQHSRRFLTNWSNPVVQQVHDRIVSGKNIDQLKLLYSSPH
jgi:hypothetical protein